MKLTKNTFLSFLLSAHPSSIPILVSASELLRHGRNLQDNTPPALESLSPSAGTFITSSSNVVFRVTVSDESPIRNVKFQLRDPDGNVGSSQNGQLEADNGSTEEWRSPPMDLGSAHGTWSWRVRVVDDADARNQYTMPWTGINVLTGENPALAAVGMIRAEIEDLANSNAALRPKFLRLGFHDCVGGCDGCIDATNPDNNGLDVPIDALVPIVNKYAHDADLTAAIGSPVTRADIWALATLVGVDQAVGDARPEVVTYSMTHIGRPDCADGVDGYGGPDRELPGADFTTHELVAFFEDNFGFTSDETVCIMGAHSIGVASRRNSGFDGQHGWVNNPTTLSNGYYDMLIGGSVDPDNFYDLIHAPQWTQELIRNNNQPGVPSRIQWFHQKVPCGAGSIPDCDDPGDDPRTFDKIIMTNSDIALVRDLSGYFENVTVDNSDGTEEVVPGSVTACSFRCGGRDRETGCPNRNPPLCPHAAETFWKAKDYKFDNDLFLEDFEAVVDKMIKNGHGEGDLVEVEGAAAPV